MPETSTMLAAIEQRSSTPELVALAGFLAGYGEVTRKSYATDLRMFATWCGDSRLGLFDIKRAHIEIVRSVNGREWSDALNNLSQALHDHVVLQVLQRRNNSSTVIPQSTSGVRKSTMTNSGIDAPFGAQSDRARPASLRPVVIGVAAAIAAVGRAP